MTEEQLIYHRNWRAQNRAKCLSASQRCYRRHAEDRKAYRKRVQQIEKRMAFEAYGGKCACCGEAGIHFLSIDHIHGGGNKHRREIGSGGYRFYVWLRLRNYPPGYQVLCFNCNMGRAFNGGGVCPHQRPPETLKELCA